MFLLPSVSLPMFKILMDAFHPSLSSRQGMLKLTHPHGPGLEGPPTHPISQKKNIPQCELSCSQLCILLCMQLLWATQASQNFSVGDCGCPKAHPKTTDGICKYSQQAYFQNQIPSDNCIVVICTTWLYKKLWTLKHNLFKQPAAIFPFLPALRVGLTEGVTFPALFVVTQLTLCFQWDVICQI